MIQSSGQLETLQSQQKRCHPQGEKSETGICERSNRPAYQLSKRHVVAYKKSFYHRNGIHHHAYNYKLKAVLLQLLNLWLTVLMISYVALVHLKIGKFDSLLPEIEQLKPTGSFKIPEITIEFIANEIIKLETANVKVIDGLSVKL